MFPASESLSWSIRLRLDRQPVSWRQGARPAVRRPIVALCTLFLLVACDPAELPFSPRPVAPAFTISDGANGGTAGFYFLSPLVPDPDIAGTFDPALAPDVRICELGASGCAAMVASF